MPTRFPYLPISAARAESFLMPLLPLDLQHGRAERLKAHGILDSGATVNVLPYTLGVRLGAVWEVQTTRVILSGNLAAHEARALLLEAHVAHFPPVRLVFAWTRAEAVPLLLGQMNFFQEFDVCLHRARLQFEIEPAERPH
jgi:hypothetical protein